MLDFSAIDSDALAASFRARAVTLLRKFGGDVITSCDPDPPCGSFFLAEAVSEHEAGRIRVYFGDREFEVRTSIRPVGRPWHLDLAYYLKAMHVDSSSVTDSMWIHTEERLEVVLEAQRVGLEACLSILSDDPVHWWRQAEEVRQAHLVEGQAQMRRQELRTAESRAEAAFNEGDFPRVVDLLEPYADILSAAQARKLDLARERRGDK